MQHYKYFIQSPILQRHIMQSNAAEMNDETMKDANSLAGKKREAEERGKYDGEEEEAKTVSPEKSREEEADGMDVEEEEAAEAAEDGGSPQKTDYGTQDIRHLFGKAKQTSAVKRGAFDNVGKGAKQTKQQQQQFKVENIVHRNLVHVELAISNTNQVPKAVRDAMVQAYTRLYAEAGKQLILLQVTKGGRPIKPITNPSEFPHQWADIKKVALVYNNDSDFKKPIKDKPRTFKVVMKLGSAIPTEEILSDISIDMMNEGITAEIKRHQAPFSKKDMIIFMAPRHLSPGFMQGIVQDGIRAGVEEYINGDAHKSQMGKGLQIQDILTKGLLDVLVSVNYPPNYFHERGQKFRFNNQDKMAWTVEYDAEAEELIRGATKHIRSYFQHYIGRKVYLAFAPDDDSGLSSLTFYREKCDKHLVFQSCTASTKLHGIENMDGGKVIPLREEAGGGNVKISLRKLLQEYTLTGSDVPVVLAMGLAHGSVDSWEVYFPQAAVYEQAMEKVMAHVASWAMYRLYYTYGCTSDGIHEYINGMFSSMERRIAFHLSSYDVDNDVITIDRSSLEVDDEEKDDNDEWMDMSILSPEGVSTLNKASMQAGILFDPEEQSSLGSLDTNAFEARKQGGAAATGNIVRGLGGSKGADTSEQAGSGNNGTQTTSGSSPEGEGQSSAASSGESHCGGQQE